MKQIPNLLTISRIIVIPILIASFYIEGRLAHWVAAALFLTASVTDFFDGYLARAWSVQSKLGRFLDPIADKLLVVSAILMLVCFDDINRFHIFPALAIVCREILVSGLREFLAELNVSLPVSKLGKVKTTFQMIALFLLLLGTEGSGISLTDTLGLWFLWIAAGLTLFTGYAYLKAGFKHMEAGSSS